MISQTVNSPPVDGAKQKTTTNGNGLTTTRTPPTRTPPPTSAGDDVSSGGKRGRQPRWTRGDIIVLIQGKRLAENRARKGPGFGSGRGVETKWEAVSAHCRRLGVDRGAVQCRKRWSNLAADYRKIKEWESGVKEETESFWVMRSDVRRERKLPGFFDKEVYDTLNGAAEEEMRLVVFDGGRSGAAAGEEGLFSDFENGEGDDDVEVEVEIFKEAVPIQMAIDGGVPGRISGIGTANERHPAPNPQMGSASQDCRKRRRHAADIDDDVPSFQDHLIDVLERSSEMLGAQLKSQNANFQLDREQRKAHEDSLVAVLNKLADAIGKIADKL